MNYSPLRLAAALILWSLVLVAQADVAQDIESLLAQNKKEINGVMILAGDIVTQVYRDNAYQPYWVDPKNIQELMELIADAPGHGLNPADYNMEALQAILQQRQRDPSAGMLAETDIMLTESLMRYGYHRRYGKANPSQLDPNINFQRQTFRNQSPSKTMKQLLAADSLEGFIELAAPSGPFYRRVQYWLETYRQLADRGGWPVISEGPTLRLGDTGPRVAEIRVRLEASGDLEPGAATNPSQFDDSLKDAVVSFQSRHALDADGIVGRQTLAAMNVPVTARIDQLRASLERLRWVNQEAADTLIAVNIAGFRAFFYDGGEPVWSTRIMVGKSYRQTPVFRGDIQYLEFNPTWTIPPGILRNDTLPAIKRNPDYLASKHIRVIDRNGRFVDPATVDWNQYSRGVPYTLRQDPGPWNALGTVKFIFPNKHFVFLHDTPHAELFDRPERAFSSGCIRVDDPLRLAELVLDDAKYDRSGLEAIIDSAKTQRINLDETIPVLIVYLTASVDTSGNLLFYRDIYDRDERVLRALDGPVIIDAPSPGG